MKNFVSSVITAGDSSVAFNNAAIIRKINSMPAYTCVCRPSPSIKAKLTLCLIKHNPIKTYGESESFTTRLVYLQGQSAQYPLNTRRTGLRGKFQCCGEQKISCPSLQSNYKLLCHIAYSLVPVLSYAGSNIYSNYSLDLIFNLHE
jgi:hypothetical protein